MSIDDEFCLNCGTSRKGTTKPESTASATGSMLRRLGRLKSLKVMTKHTLFESPLAQVFETRQPLPIDEGQITKIETDRRIRRGDKVRQIP